MRASTAQGRGPGPATVPPRRPAPPWWLPALVLAACAPDPADGAAARQAPDGETSRPAHDAAGGGDGVAGPWGDAATADGAAQDGGPGSCPGVQPRPGATLQPGRAVYGEHGYIQYVPGTLPLILSAPHGGTLKPASIADRTSGVILKDTHSAETTWEVARLMLHATGRWPHVVINRLHRVKLDANRPIGEAAQGDPTAEKAWKRFHAFIGEAKLAIEEQCGGGLFADMHTHAHKEGRVELGYRISAKQLALPDADLNAAALVEQSSLRHLASSTQTELATLLRGPGSIGAAMQAAGFAAVPSPAIPHPAGAKYFSGGYNTETHGSQHGGVIDGVQVESWTKGITPGKRTPYAAALAHALLGFVQTHHGFALDDPDWKPPAHARCSGALPVALLPAGATVIDSTSAADNEFGSAIRCGHTFALDGPQLYFRLDLTAGETYTIDLRSDFPARLYLFTGPCVPEEIDASCATSGLSGELVKTNSARTFELEAATTGPRVLVVDSRDNAWHGGFVLTIR